MKRIRVLIISLGLLFGFGLVAPAVAGHMAYADSAVQTACGALGSSDCSNKNGGTGLNKIVSAIINVLSIVVGIVSVIMIIIGGLRYVTSNGDSNNISAAKNTILYAVIGLVIVGMAQFIVQFVLNRIT